MFINISTRYDKDKYLEDSKRIISSTFIINYKQSLVKVGFTLNITNNTSKKKYSMSINKQTYLYKNMSNRSITYRKQSPKEKPS